MFEFVRKHTRLLQFVLVLLIFPSFVFFGIQGYSRFTEGGNATVAKVAGKEITQGEWDAAHRDQIERVRRQMPGVDAKLFDTPEMRQRTLEGLMRERVMLAAADKLHLVTTDDRLQRLFATDPQFATIRNPDGSVNKEILAAQGMSSEMFAQRLRQDLSMRQVLQGLAGTAFGPATSSSSAFDALLQQREVQVQRFEAKSYLAKVSPSDADIEAYYKDPAHAAQLQSPEQASIEYLVLDIDALKKDIKVSDEELRKYYTENLQRYSSPEERRASHILIKADKSAPAAEREKARAKADKLLAEVKKNPASFADLARKNSEDPGSAERGGDLDFFGRGAMVKPFEDAAFGLAQGAISDVVESDFGYHIIQMTGKRGGETRSFESARAEIEDEVRKQLAQRKFTEVAVEFTNMVYEQADSLKPAADKFKLEVRTAQGVQRVPGAQASGPLGNAKFLEALFGNDALRNKRNTEAVEVGPSQLASGRIVQYSPAQLRPLAEVKSLLRDVVAAQQAAAMAVKEGQARLAQLRAAPDTALSEPALVISRAQLRELPRGVVDAALREPSTKLPAFAGVDLGAQGYAVIKLTKVLGRDPAAADDARAKSQYAQAWADAESQAYYAALKTRLRADQLVHAASSPATAQN
jgi:peptidyl-prolyl cis-trans isomerase D